MGVPKKAAAVAASVRMPGRMIVGFDDDAAAGMVLGAGAKKGAGVAVVREGGMDCSVGARGGLREEERGGGGIGEGGGVGERDAADAHDVIIIVMMMVEIGKGGGGALTKSRACAPVRARAWLRPGLASVITAWTGVWTSTASATAVVVVVVAADIIVIVCGWRWGVSPSGVDLHLHLL